MIKALLRSLAVSAALLVAAPAMAQQAQHVPVMARQIASFQIGHDATRFGPLEFVGGLDLTSSLEMFGSFSSMRFLSPGKEMMGVTDTGYWFFATVERDAKGLPTGLADLRMQPFLDKAGKPITDKWYSDAEGFAIKGDVATASFERDHRVTEFRLRPGNMGPPLRDLDILIPKRELRQNRGLEAIAYAPANGPLKGALVVVSEKSIDRKGNLFAAVLDGPRKGVFFLKKDARYDVTDSAFLPDGDLLLLERSFSMASGIGMRLRRIPAEAITGGADNVDGPVIFEAGMAYQIDNMEAMDVWTRADGATMISLMSDDNGSMLQRSIYLEFRLHE